MLIILKDAKLCVRGNTTYLSKEQTNAIKGIFILHIFICIPYNKNLFWNSDLLSVDVDSICFFGCLNYNASKDWKPISIVLGREFVSSVYVATTSYDFIAGA